MFSQEVIEKVKRDELDVLICMAGKEPGIPGMAVGFGECCSCHGVIHYDLANEPVIQQRGLVPLCHLCFIDSGLFNRDVFEKEGEALVGGQSLNMKEGIEAVRAMVDSTKESN